MVLLKQLSLQCRPRSIVSVAILVFGGSAAVLWLNRFMRQRMLLNALRRSALNSEKKTVLVTGATGGIGFHLVRTLLIHDARVIMAVRDLTKARDVATKIRADILTGEIIIFYVDLSSMASIRGLFKKVEETENSLDCLLNLAGYFGPRNEKMRMTDDGFEYHFQVNYLAPYMLTRLFETMLRRSQRKPSILNITSTLSSRCASFDLADINFADSEFSSQEAYARSKHALNLATRHMSRAMEGIRVNALHPGIVITEMHRRHCGPNPFVFMAWKCVGWVLFNSAEYVGETVAHCLLNESTNSTGCLFTGCGGRLEKWNDVFNGEENDTQFARQLCEFSQKVCDIERKH